MEKEAKNFFRDSLSRTRIIILGVAALIPVSVLIFRRLITGTPFFTAKTKRDFTVYNKSEFFELYDKDAIPSKAPIEPLEGLFLSNVLEGVAG